MGIVLGRHVTTLAVALVSLVMVLAIHPLVPPPILIALATDTATYQTNQTQKFMPAVLIKLWQVRHKVYMTKFYRSKYVVVFDKHGDVSLDGKYISAMGTAWIYRVSDGKLLGKLYGPGTWLVESWEPFRAKKIWDRSGFFSADGTKMVEDIYVYGTGARVVDLRTLKTYPLMFPFTAGRASFYACQLDYSGNTLVAGYIAGGLVYVLKFDGKAYRVVQVLEGSGNYGRRLQVTLDGGVIVVGGLWYGYLDIWVFDGTKYERVVHYELPDPGGIGALGITDPINVGYIIAGTRDGWIIVAHFDRATKRFQVIYQEKVAPDNSWFYNPFYERWIPKRTPILVACAHDNGYAVVYDLLTNTAKVMRFDTFGYQASAATLDPTARYAFIGNTMYMVVVRDPLSGTPRVRMWGVLHVTKEQSLAMPALHLIANVSELPLRVIPQPIRPPTSTPLMVGQSSANATTLTTPITIAPPETNMTMYFFGGEVTIKKVYAKPGATDDLVRDPLIAQGDLSSMYNRKLVALAPIYLDGADVESAKLYPGTEPEGRAVLEALNVTDYRHFVVAHQKLVFHETYTRDEAWTALAVRVPLDKPVRVYDSIKLDTGIVYVQKVTFTDAENKMLAKLGECAVAGAVLAASLVVLGLIPVTWAIAAIAVGIALLTYGAPLLLQSDVLKDMFTTKTYIAVAPIVEDQYGNRYIAVNLYLPISEMENAEHIKEVLGKAFNKTGYRYGILIDYIGNTLEEYKKIISGSKEGFSNIATDILSLLRETIVAKYNLTESTLTIKEILILFLGEYVVKNPPTTVRWDIHADVLTVVGVSYFSVKGRLKGGEITDPHVLASLLEEIEVNGVRYRLVASPEGAYTSFAFTVPTDRVTIKFPETLSWGYYGKLDIDLYTMLIAPMHDYENMSYVAQFTYDLSYLNMTYSMKVNMVEYVDMPYRMVKSETRLSYSNVTTTVDTTNMFELSVAIDTNMTVSGKAYYYISADNVTKILPIGGGTLLPGEHLEFWYYYKMPANVEVKLAFDNGRRTSTLPHYAMLHLLSNVNQTVTVAVDVEAVGAGASHKVLYVVPLKANETMTIPVDLADYLDDVIYARGAETAYLKITARLVNATANMLESDDQDTLVYLPPKPLAGNVTLLKPIPLATAFNVYDATTGANVTATLYIVENGNVSTVGTQTQLLPKTYTVVAVAEGYMPHAIKVLVYGANMTFNIPMVTFTPTSNLTIVVYNGELRPVANADVTVEDVASNTVVASGVTDSSGRLVLSLAQPVYIARIRVAVGGAVAERVVVLDHDPYVVTMVVGGEGAVVKAVDLTFTPVSVEGVVGNRSVVVGATGLAVGNQTVCVGTSCVNTRGVNEVVFVLPQVVHAKYYPVPANATLPAIDGKAWLLLHTITQDGMPAKGAVVTTSTTVQMPPTDSWGLTYALLPTGTIEVNVTSPVNNTLVFSANVTLSANTMLLVTMPYTSGYFESTLALLGMTLLSWGFPAWDAEEEMWSLPITMQLLIYSAVPQQITLNISLYNVTGNKWEVAKNVTLSLGEGVTEYMDTLPIMFNETLIGHEVKGYAEITSFESDTDTSDNAVWSNNTLTLPTFCDIRLILLYKPIKQSKGPWYLLPEDTIETEVGIVVPAPLNTPVKVYWQVLSHDLKTDKQVYEKVGSTELTPIEPTTYWINRTVDVPWTDQMVLSAKVYYKWDLSPFNNYDNITLAIDTDAKIEIVSMPSIVSEGDLVTIRVKVVSNVPAGKKSGVLFIADNTTGRVLARVEVPLAPEEEIPLQIKVPENPPLSKYAPFIHEPSRILPLTIALDAPDPVPYNNIKTASLLVQASLSTIILMVVLAMVAVLVVIGVAKSVVKTVEDVRRRRTRFVHKKEGWS